MLAKPRMDEPSKSWPTVKNSSSTVDAGMLKCFDDCGDYVVQKRAIPLAARQDETDTLLRRMGKLRQMAPGDSLLELGCGTGWMLVLAARSAASDDGVDHNPALVEASLASARDEGVDIDVRLGGAEAGQVATGVRLRDREELAP